MRAVGQSSRRQCWTGGGQGQAGVLLGGEEGKHGYKRKLDGWVLLKRSDYLFSATAGLQRIGIIPWLRAARYWGRMVFIDAPSPRTNRACLHGWNPHVLTRVLGARCQAGSRKASSTLH